MALVTGRREQGTLRLATAHDGQLRAIRTAEGLLLIITGIGRPGPYSSGYFGELQLKCGHLSRLTS
jgi:hypothetical protein